MDKIKPWIKTAHKLLNASLHPLPHELNELDWKSTLSENKGQLTRHLSAFANHPEGGFLAFGITPEGQIEGVDTHESEDIINKLANLSRSAVEPPQKIDHYIDMISDSRVLFVHIHESEQKPVHIRGKGIEYSYIRSGGQTRKMSRQEIANSILQSKQFRYEELEALSCKRSDVFSYIDYEKIVALLALPQPKDEDAVLDQLINQKLVYRHGQKYSITNLGTVIAARDVRHFPHKERLGIRVIKYSGSSRIETETEREFTSGYAIVFQDLVKYVISQLPSSEIIQDALRTSVPLFPEITIRELVANALIHRDFSITSTNIMIEIFSDRLEITNPGSLLPTVKIERIIDTAPESRNELLAAFMRRIGICEERGSGIDKALFAIEVYGLPPIEFTNTPNAFKVSLFKPKKFKQMTSEERMRACYQHCCLKYVSGEHMTNNSFRTRLGLKKNQYTQAWKIIKEAVERNFIKPGSAHSRSRRFAYYVPFWA